jgi:hypothetical protein
LHIIFAHGLSIKEITYGPKHDAGGYGTSWAYCLAAWLCGVLCENVDLGFRHIWLNCFAGESIPVRLFLTPYELTPTYRNINNKFSVKYYLNLVLVDEEDRRYFKQQEITIYRLLDTPQAS